MHLNTSFESKIKCGTGITAFSAVYQHQSMYLLHPPSAVSVGSEGGGRLQSPERGAAPDITILNFSLDSSCQLALQYSTLTPTDRYLPVSRTADR